MTTLDRRGFLRLAGGGALAAMMPGSIRRALAVPAHNATGTIADVEHIVILMQENRSFDHYFGTLRGVRGFGDPRAVRQRNGKSIFAQPHGDGNLLPFRPDASDLGSTFIEDLPHDWNTTHAAFNDGAWDRWVASKGTTTMAHLARADVPFYFALADAFTICDAYHCSVLGPTDPNRFYLWTGCTGNLGDVAPAVDNAEGVNAWSTYPERLERANISWKIYQDLGNGLDSGSYWGWTSDPHIGNYGNNSLLYFRQYQAAVPGDPLFERARRGTSIAAGEDALAGLRADIARGSLANVSWIVAPEAYSEHPNWPANNGASYVSQVLDALTANPEVWSKTALFLTYDENDGFFDHVPPPFAPASRTQGMSTIACEDEIHPGDATWQRGPYGLGPRVPMLVVSPWSRGGYVDSQVFDHTSIIRFIEQRFAAGNPDLIETNISAWRRAVCGDLTSAFDFANPNAAMPTLPRPKSVGSAMLARKASYIPASPREGTVLAQETGVRPARALPYRIDANAHFENGMGSLTVSNSGSAATVFHVRSTTQAGGPWVYTVEPGKSLVESWLLSADSAAYDFCVHGPNGFMRRFQGAAFADKSAASEPQIDFAIEAETARVTIAIANVGGTPMDLVVVDAYSGSEIELAVAPGERIERDWDTDLSLRWYELRIANRADRAFGRHFAGYIENGRDGFSDPAIGAASGIGMRP